MLEFCTGRLAKTPYFTASVGNQSGQNSAHFAFYRGPSEAECLPIYCSQYGPLELEQFAQRERPPLGIRQRRDGNFQVAKELVNARQSGQFK